jgi:hypothetical protein
LASLGLIPVLAGAFGVVFYMQQEYRRAIVSMCTLAVVFATGVFGFGTVLVDKHRRSEVLMAHITEQSESVPVATFGCLESSWGFYGGRPIYELAPHVQRGDWRDNRENEWDKKQWPSPEQFVATHPDAMIITTRDDLQRLKPRLPNDFQIIDSAPYFLQKKELVLLGRSEIYRGTISGESRMTRSPNENELR